MRKLIVAAVAALAVMAVAQHEDSPRTQHTMVTPADIKWGAGPNMFEPGMQMAVLSGDPTKAEHFTVRVKVPAGYLIKPHWHPADEHVTVVSGLINVGILNSMEPVTTLDRAIAKAYGVGSFATMPARKPHFAFAGPEGVELQIHGMGPFAMTYLDPQDDPRNRRR